ncbi:bola-like protein [Microdochium trichocladiopsis]|uniref:Bola-like protein n=1 Tax=Microdochium trichocladiopsis TaxID=1682393 RepID=A0A9P8YCM9_9PEZI|nr:bola-like protein [Microdochium trichocladiopsis]KAH7038311.1 bola-like protein [Microdochium trichocladiopsis]
MLCSQCQRITARAASRSGSTLRQLAAPSASAFSNSSSASARVRYTTSTHQPIPQLSRAAGFRNGVSSLRPYSSTITTPPPAKPDYLDENESQIWDKLAAEFAPTELSVKDISGGCGSMYGIEIASEKFRGTNMLKQQRMVNAVLGEQMKEWHGVQLRTKVPQA